MNKCEKCFEGHDGEYGSGRFCSQKCARGFATFYKRIDINQRVSEKLKNPRKWTIDFCKLCNGKYIVKNYKQRFCSKKCSSKDNGSKSNNFKSYTSLEWSEINRKNHKNGKNPARGGRTKWLQYKDFKVQGNYELRVCKILDLMKNNNEIYDWEYSRDRFQYFDINNCERTYITDFKIFLEKENVGYVEVKGFEREKDRINNRLKWKAVQKSGYKIDVWSLFEIQWLEFKYGGVL